MAFQVRAERAGSGDGRTYAITYTALDASGNTATDVAYVTVPRDRSGHVAAAKSERRKGR